MTVQSSVQTDHLYLEQSLEGKMADGYQVQISHETEDSEWDTFLAHTAGGHHTQTSLWAQVKATLGWKVARIIVRRDDRIVAGAQLLFRAIPMLGTYGYMSKAPILSSDDPALFELLLRN